jgi:hypothetical protein
MLLGVSIVGSDLVDDCKSLGADHIEDFDFSKAVDLERLVVIQKVRPGIPQQTDKIVSLHSVVSILYQSMDCQSDLSRLLRPPLYLVQVHPKLALTVDKPFVVGYMPQELCYLLRGYTRFSGQHVSIIPCLSPGSR